MLGGVENKPYSIWNYGIFILTIDHWIGIFNMKNLGELMHG